MPDLKITVGGRNFFITCEKGQEEDLKNASFLLNNEVDKLKGDIGKTTEDKFLLMAGLIMSDKLIMKDKDLENIKKSMQMVEEELSLVKEELNVLRQKNIVSYDYEEKLKDISMSLDTIIEKKDLKKNDAKDGEGKVEKENHEKQSSLF